VRFAKALTALAEGGMILVSPPVEKILDGALDQLSNSMKGVERLNVPRLVHMGALVFKVSTWSYFVLLHEKKNRNIDFVSFVSMFIN
jgi:hypothetical protein